MANHTHSHPTYEKPASTPVVSPCSCTEPPPVQSCCELICFERPRYFCGHLLTDADLSKEQRYVIEKHKLYHRSLHGHGVVCGLRLTCDHHCPGHILIDEGYAIDDCGHDLVVCEPRRFDVIGRLKEKGYLVETSPPDPCKPAEKEPECNVRQCFQITICYREEEADFTTPFIGGCRPQLTECEATRVRETVEFDVVAEPPKQVTWQERLTARIEACYKLFSEGRFADALQETTKDGELFLELALGGKAIDFKTYWDYFCKLRGLLLLYLSKHRDNYNCTIEDDIRAIKFPSEKEGDNFNTGVKDAFCDLLGLAYQHVIACVMGAYVFDCPEPCAPSCVVLGSVVVENGRLVRVCNCPRSYVWSFASFFDVLTATLFGELACEKETHGMKKADCNGQQPENSCCRKFELNCDCFIKWLQFTPKAPLNAATEITEFIEKFRSGIQETFDFTDACLFSTRDLKHRPIAELMKLAKKLNLDISESKEPLRKHPLPVLETAGLVRQGPIMVTVSDEGDVTDAVVHHLDVVTQVTVLQKQVDLLTCQLAELQAGKEKKSAPKGGEQKVEGTPESPKRSRGSRGEEPQ